MFHGDKQAFAIALILAVMGLCTAVRAAPPVIVVRPLVNPPIALPLRVPPPAPSSAAPFLPPYRTAPYSLPYGGHFTRPSGSPIVPFGSSRYYYHR